MLSHHSTNKLDTLIWQQHKLTKLITYMAVSRVNEDKESGMLPVNWLSERNLPKIKHLYIN